MHVCSTVACCPAGASRNALRLGQPAAKGTASRLSGIAEDGFDPARINDFYSHSVVIHICESLYTYDYLAIPAEIRPLTAAAMPEHSPDYRTWTIRVRPGIYFTPDPAFKGQRRELVAADYVYSFKRFADPVNNSPQWADFEELRIKGLSRLRRDALDGKRPFDYDHEIDGLRALDRYTLQFQLETPRPRLVHKLVSGFKGAVAREVVEAHGGRIMEHPVGTGPFKLGQWRRSSFIVLERNPDYREVFFDAQPGPDDVTGQAIAARLHGRRLPMVDRVEISIITENQPRWLTFVDGKIDTIEVPSDFLRLAMPGGKVAPYLERRDIQGSVIVSHAVSYYYFNMEDPIVGGYSPDKIALRRAVGLGMNVERSIALARGGQGLVAQSAIAAHVRGFDAGFRSENGEYDPARSKALLDTYGYLDRDGDGWRELPNGEPLVLAVSTDPSQISRQMDELFQKDMQAIGAQGGIQGCPVAGKRQGFEGRQTDDVAARHLRARTRRHGFTDSLLRAGGRRQQPVALQAPGDGRALRERSVSCRTGPSATRCLTRPSASSSPTCPRRPPCIGCSHT